MCCALFAPLSVRTSAEARAEQGRRTASGGAVAVTVASPILCEASDGDSIFVRRHIVSLVRRCANLQQVRQNAAAVRHHQSWSEI